MTSIFNAEEYRAEISAKMGVPIELLTAANPDAIEAQAKAVKKYIRSLNPMDKTANRESFAEFMAEYDRIGRPDVSAMVDKGEVQAVPKPPTTREQFAEWAANNLK